MNPAAIQRNFNFDIPTRTRPLYILIVVWALSMISLPIFKWTFGESAIVWGVNVTTLLQAFTTVVILAFAWGTPRALRAAGLVVLLTWGVEAIGTATGFPFGHYDYTALLQPQLLNVPVLIAFAWLMMIPSAWAVAYLVNGRQFGWRFVVLSGLAMTAWDLFLDPQMVGWGLWQWTEVSGFSYFGIPWVNFLGWFATAALITLVIRPRELPVMPLLTIYGVVWVLQTIGQVFFWGLIGPAVVGFLGMGVFVVLALYRITQPDNSATERAHA